MLLAELKGHPPDFFFESSVLVFDEKLWTVCDVARNARLSAAVEIEGLVNLSIWVLLAF